MRGSVACEGVGGGGGRAGGESGGVGPLARGGHAGVCPQKETLKGDWSAEWWEHTPRLTNRKADGDLICDWSVGW
jgi:hypothetical protein